LRNLYNFADYKPQVPQQNAIGIASYTGQFINNEDLQAFYKDQRPEAVGSKYQLISINGKRYSIYSRRTKL
jgi:tripeptidyl-peptidase-1